MVAPGLLRDHPLVRAARLCEDAARGIRDRQGADEARRSLGHGYPGKLAQEPCIVGTIALVATAGGARVPRRMDAGRAAQRVHLEAGILRQAGTAEMLGVVPGLEPRVVFERGAVFLRLLQHEAEIVE